MYDKIKNDELDDFWNLEKSVPSKKISAKSREPIITANIEIPVRNNAQRSDAAHSDTVIKRYIDPMHYEHKKIKKEMIERSEVFVD